MLEPKNWKTKILCKCCASTANIFCVVDFSKNCSERRGVFLPLSGTPIYYYRCTECGFIFTADFDDFSGEEMKTWIYNEEYTTVDPSREEDRPRATADIVIRNFKQFGQSLSVLDYGCGSGRLSEILCDNGFANVVGYDPLVEKFSTMPKQKNMI